MDNRLVTFPAIIKDFERFFADTELNNNNISDSSCVPDVKIESQTPIKCKIISLELWQNVEILFKDFHLKKQNQNFVPVQQPQLSNTSLSMPESTDCFLKGSTITLENGECKKIEDLNQDDFVKVQFSQNLLNLTVLSQCAQVTTDKKLIRSVLTEMNEMSVKSAMVSLHFRVQVTGQNVSEKS